MSAVLAKKIDYNENWLLKLQNEFVSPKAVTGSHLIEAVEANIVASLPISEVLLHKFISGNKNVSVADITEILTRVRIAMEDQLFNDHDLFINYCHAMALCARELDARSITTTTH